MIDWKVEARKWEERAKDANRERRRVEALLAAHQRNPVELRLDRIEAVLRRLERALDERGRER